MTASSAGPEGSIATEKPPATTAYRLDSARSRDLYQKALGLMPGGNTRHSITLAPYPIYASTGRGCRVVDVEGEERIDFVNNFTAVIVGHANPKVIEAVQDQLESGTAFSMPTERDLELASLIVERVGNIDKIRFCNSGSEAVMLAIKAARAHTGRPKIAKMEGGYHGIYDYAQVSEGPTADQWGEARAPASIVEPGCSPAVARDVIVLPWNDEEACVRLIEENKSELAAILVDPLPAGIGFIPPRPGFLERLREVTRQCGVLFISDEVMSFRLHYHGALHELGIEADLTSLGKIIGGGFPIGAVAGRDDVMEVFDHTKQMKVHHGGTFNANPISMSAGLAAMRQMTPEAYDRLGGLGDYLRAQLSGMFAARGIGARVLGMGSLFSVTFAQGELQGFRSLKEGAEAGPDIHELCHEMLGRGILIPSYRLFGCLSTPMTERELDCFVNAMDESLSAQSVSAAGRH